METYIGIDLGGTKLLIGEIDSRGNILRHKKYVSGFFNQADAVSVIKASLDDYKATVGWYDEEPLAMGVGLIGRVDTKQGIWLQIDPGRTQAISLASELSKIYGIPCRIDNDVKSATRAERVWGFGQISKDFVYINIGTGIAAGIVVKGRQIRGSHCNAGEVGHIRVGVNVGVRCACGKIDCVEAIASGIGFDQCARLLANHYQTQLHIPDIGERIPTTEIFALSQKGDELCVKLVENAAEAVSNLIMNMVRMCDPDTVVLGGGVVADDYLYSKILERLHPTTMRFVQNGVVITKLNPEFIGLLGAGAVAMDM
jgi:predicted NBD/HSP70 family sugar kinase